MEGQIAIKSANARAANGLRGAGAMEKGGHRRISAKTYAKAIASRIGHEADLLKERDDGLPKFAFRSGGGPARIGAAAWRRIPPGCR
jgi:hypothetical protein